MTEENDFLEIERKFLVKQIPVKLDQYPKRELLQGYIASNPVLRLRRSDSDCMFTFKNGIGLEREEFESPLTQAQFEELWSLVSGKEIAKTRYFIPLAGGFTAEFDMYHGRLQGLFTVEVEFSSVEQAETFTPPDWFGEDVTCDIRYTNSNLSKNLPPQIYSRTTNE